MSPEMTNGVFAIAGAVIGAVLTGGITLYQVRSSARRKELTITSKYPTRLVELDQQFSQHVEVRVGGKIVPTVYVVDFSTLNSGNEVLQELEVPVSFYGDGEVVTVSLGETNFSASPEDCTVEQRDPTVSLGETNFSASPEDCTVEQRDPNLVVLRIKYLNPGDQLFTRVMLSGRPKRFKNDFRQPGVKCRQRVNLEGTDTGAFSEILLHAIRQNALLHASTQLMVPAYRRYVHQLRHKDHSKSHQRVSGPERGQP